MCNLNFPFPLNLPPRGNPARLPMLLVPVLALAALVQVALPLPDDLPPAGAVARVRAAAASEGLARVSVAPALAQRNLFAAGGGGEAAEAAPDPLGGAMFAGAVQQGRRRMAVVQMPDGHVKYLGAGGQIAGWRLVALLPQGVRLSQGAQKIDVSYGQRAALASAMSGRSQSEDEQ